MSRLKGLIRELIRHHNYASKQQVEVVRRAEVARQQLAKRGGDDSINAQAKPCEYRAKEFDPESLKSWKLEQINDKHLEEITEFLKHQLQYKELLARYQTASQDTLERVQATARRVGLDASKL